LDTDANKGKRVVINNPMKKILNYIMKFFSFPFYMMYLFCKLLFGKRRAFGSVMQSVSLFPGVSGEWLRRGVLQWITGKRLENCCISFGCTFSDPRVSIGDGVYLGSRCDIGYARIGNDCVIGSAVHILSGGRQHDFTRTDVPIRNQGGSFENISVGRDSWIGNGSIIVADIGTGCVIGAGSVVVKPIFDFGIAVGNPAQVVRYRTAPEDGKR